MQFYIFDIYEWLSASGTSKSLTVILVCRVQLGIPEACSQGSQCRTVGSPAQFSVKSVRVFIVIIVIIITIKIMTIIIMVIFNMAIIIPTNSRP